MATQNANVQFGQAPEWERVLATTLDKIADAMHDATFEQTLLLRELQRKGKVKTGQSGAQLLWNVKFKKRAFEAFEDLEQVTYARQQIFKQAALGWASYKKEDAISEREQLINRGTEAIYNVFDRMVQDMRTETEDQLTEQMYIDNTTAAAAVNSLAGLNTFFAESGTTSAAGIGTNAGTYATLNMAKGTFGGSDSSDAEFDFWSSVLVNTPSGTSITDVTSVTGTAPIIQTVRTAISETQRSNNAKGMVDLGLCGRPVWRALLNNLQSEERIIAGRTDLTNAGFNTVMFDGVAIAPDVAITSSVNADGGQDAMFLLNTDQMEFHLLTDKLFRADSAWDYTRFAWVFSLRFYGQLMTKSPRYHSKIFDIA